MLAQINRVSLLWPSLTQVTGLQATFELPGSLVQASNEQAAI